MTLTNAQLIHAAERRVLEWIIYSNAPLPGLPQEAIMAQAKARVDRLDAELISLAPHEVDAALSEKSAERDQAFADARNEIAKGMHMVKSLLDLDNANANANANARTA